MSDKDLIECASHGATRSTFSCIHLLKGVACGYHAASSDPADPWPDAWCDRCEATAVDIQIACTHCYDAARARNEHPPRYARGENVQMSEIEAGILLHHATHELQALQAAATERWDLGSFARWDYDDDTKVIMFSDPARRTVIADVRMVGSYHKPSSTFQWAWKTYEDEPPLPQVDRVRVFGEVRGLARLREPGFECDDTEGWQLTSLAGYLLGAEAAYRAPMDDLHVYMLLANLRHSTEG